MNMQTVFFPGLADSMQTVFSGLADMNMQTVFFSGLADTNMQTVFFRIGRQYAEHVFPDWPTICGPCFFLSGRQCADRVFFRVADNMQTVFFFPEWPTICRPCFFFVVFPPDWPTIYRLCVSGLADNMQTVFARHKRSGEGEKEVKSDRERPRSNHI